MINQGFEFMIIGMSVVFSFLIVLVFAMNLMSVVLKLINKIIPEVEEKKAAVPVMSNDAEIALAIATAVSMRNK